MSTALADQVIVPARYNGPARSGNGGYVSGLLAHELRADHTVAGDRPVVAVAVSLRQPPPLDVPLHVTREEPDSASLTFGGVAKHINPPPVHIKTLTPPYALSLVEKNFDYFLLPPAKLL